MITRHLQYFIFLFLAFFGMLFVAKSQQTFTIHPFDQTPIFFNPDTIPNGIVEKDGIIYIGNGRIALKKIALPRFTRNTHVNITISLTSNGDPWDKSGSCFLISSNSKITMLGIADNTQKYPRSDSLKYENLVGIVSGKEYEPTLELMRFMTPFGVGHYSTDDDLLSAKHRPVYIDGWAKKVLWKQDISDLLPALEEAAFIGIFIDTWTKQGYHVNVAFNFRESRVRCDKKPKQCVKPLLNTVYYLGQKHPDIFSRKSVEIPFSIPRKAKNAHLKYIATGHGGHSDGDEFRPQEHILQVDREEVYRFLPWRTDCASFRRFNPSTGVWLKKRTVAYFSKEGKRAEKEIEEPIASSDLSRSNWCPGSDVLPETVDLSFLKAGNHILSIHIPKAKPIKDNKLNHWLISAYLVWEE